MSTAHPDVRPGHRRQPAAGRQRGRPRRRGRPGGAAPAASSPPWSRSCGAAEGAWVGWAGEPGDAPEPFDAGRHVPAPGPALRGRGRASTTRASATTPCGRSTTTSSCRRRSTATGGTTYRDVNQPLRRGGRRGRPPRAPPSGCTTTSCSSCRRWCASCARTCGSAGSTTSPSRRSSCSPSCPGARALLEGLLGADFLGFQRNADAQNFLRACRRLLGHDHQGRHRRVHPARTGAQQRTVRASAIPISVDFRGLEAARPQPRGHRPGHGDPRVAGRPARCSCSASTGSTTPRASGTGSRPTRSCCSEQGASRRRSHARAGRDAEPRARRRLPRAARARSRRRSGGSTASTRRHRLAGRPLPAPLLPPRGDGGAVPRRRRHARDAAARRHEPRRQGVRHLPHTTWAARWCSPSSPAPGTSCTRPSSATRTTSRASSRRSCAPSTPPATSDAAQMKALRRRVADHDVQRWAARYLEALEIAPRKPQRQQLQQEQAEQTGAREDRAQPRRGGPGRRGGSNRERAARRTCAAAVALARRRPKVLVATDFDGTLAPLVTDPIDGPRRRRRDGGAAGGRGAARRHGGPGLRSRRRHPAPALRRRPADEPVVLVGSHGAAHQPGRRRTTSRCSARRRRAAAQLTAEVEALVARHPGARIEHKPAVGGRCTPAAWTRRPPRRPRGGRRGGAATRTTGVHVMPGKQVVELAVLATNKGTALVDLARVRGAGADALPRRRRDRRARLRGAGPRRG